MRSTQPRGKMLSTFLKAVKKIQKNESNSMLLSAIKLNLRTHANMVVRLEGWFIRLQAGLTKCKWVWLCLFHYHRIHHFFFDLEGNCFTMLYWFLPYHNANQLWFCMYSLSPLPHPPFWEPQTCRGVVFSWGGLFQLTAQDLHESPLPCSPSGTWGQGI